MTQDSDLNPYAPPVAAVVAAGKDHEAAVRRPASVKWALAVVALLLGTIASAVGLRFLENGWADVAHFYLRTIQGRLNLAMAMVGLVFIFGGRGLLAYASGALTLASLTSVFAWAMWASDLQFNNVAAQVETLTGFVVLAVSLYLFFRFTFGGPSLHYFRVLKR
jgi:hypothetical protein